MYPIDQMKSLIREKDICVLATDAGGKPYCSLMAYVNDESCHEIYMVTLRNSKKFKNLMENPVVSLLIDSREKKPPSQQQALTVEGSFYLIKNEDKQTSIREMIRKAHPHLNYFIDDKEAEIFCIKAEFFMLVNAFNETHFHKL